MNDLDLCLEVVSRSCQPLRSIRRWISNGFKWSRHRRRHVTQKGQIVTPIRL